MSTEWIDLGLDGIEAPPAAGPQKQRKAVIFIDMEKGQPNFQFVGVNGKGYQIMRGVEVTVPEEVVEVLQNAVATRSVTDEEGRVVGQQDYHAIPYRVLRWL